MVDDVVELERGRESYAGGAWRSAYDSLFAAEQAIPLGAEDLELLATSAYMLGRDDDYVSLLERAHGVYLDSGEVLRAVRCAFWTGLSLALRGEMARATGWFGRAARLLEREGGDCVERGYLLIPIVLRHKAAGDYEAARATAAEAAEIGERFGDRDLVGLVVQEQGHALIRLRRVQEGLQLVDEAMLAVIGGELSPIVTGLVYCNTIAFCQEVYELRRAREWTAALTRWCEQHPDMVAHTGLCLVHRAEIMEFGGAWRDALAEARHAVERFAAAGMSHQRATGYALYRQGEVHRLQGAFDAADAAYREASRYGREPQPGLALLRMAQGERHAAAAAIRRVVDETSEPLARARLLPACVEIMLAVGELEAARGACRELEGISKRQGADLLGALSAQARGAVALSGGDARAALISLRHAGHLWQELGAPYEAARTRALVGMACRVLGDAEAATLELEAARGIFEQLGAAPALARIDSLTAGARSDSAHGLSERELEVLRLVAAGKSNRQIAAELVISDHTVRRHLQNIFAKLRVSSRAAATAFAFRHDLV